MSGGTFGRNVARIEDEYLIRGKGRFVDDLKLTGTLHAAFLRSPHAHALIKGIDSSAAAAVDGVHAVYTLADLKPHLASSLMVVALPSPAFRQNVHRPVLADTEVVYVGEAIAVVIADDRYIAEDAMAMIEVDFDLLEVAADCKEALRPGYPTVHHKAPHNLVAEFSIGFGEVDQVFEKAPHVFREDLWQHRGGGHAIECRGCLANYQAFDDFLTLWNSTQTPHPCRRHLSEVLGREESSIRVIAPDVGGGFGPKLVFYGEEVVVSLASILLNRPVKWIEDRREHFTATTQERDQYWDVEIAVDDDARILGVRGTLIHDHGAYSARGLNVPYGSASAMTLPYIVPAYRLDIKVALTNKVPVTPVRGAGQPQAVFAMERLLDRVARELGIGRDEVRRRNIIPGSKMPYTTALETRGGIKVVLDSGDYAKVMESALDAAGWNAFAERRLAAAKRGRLIGIGMANYVEATGRGPYEQVTVRLLPSGKLLVQSGAAPMGQGTKTMLAQIVAEHLGGDLSNLIINAGDTAAASLGFGGFNSRQAVLAGNSANQAALAVRTKMLTVAGHLLEASDSDLTIKGAAVIVKGTDRRLSFRDLFKETAGLPGYKLPGGLPPGIEATEQVVIDAMTYANGTAVSEVEVDPETGEVRLLNIVFAHDCGRVIHPKIVDGQVLGGIAHGIGNALFEWMRFDAKGQPVTTTLAEYLLITATEMPKITLVHHETPTPLNPLGVKGVGESGVIPMPACIISAIEDALRDYNVSISRSPIGPSEITDLVEKALAAAQVNKAAQKETQ